MSTHAVSCNANPIRIQLLRKAREQCLGQLVRNVRVHFVPLRPWLLSCIDVEPSTTAKVVCIIFTLDVQPPRTRIWVDDGDTVFACAVLEEPLFCAIVACAGKTGEVEEDGDFRGGGLWREV